MNRRETVESTVKTEETYRIKHDSIYIFFLNLFSKKWTFLSIFACQGRLGCKLLSGHNYVPWQLFQTASVMNQNGLANSCGVTEIKGIHSNIKVYVFEQLFNTTVKIVTNTF